MPDPIYPIRQNDTGQITAVLRDELGNALLIQGGSVLFEMALLEGGPLVVNAAAVIDDDGSAPLRGHAHYDWAPADTDTPGLYLAAFRATLAGEIQTFPNATYILVRITPDFPVTADPVVSFASNIELEDRLGIQLSPSEHERALRLLVRATGLVRRQARQHISAVTGDTFVTSGVWDERLRLPERPVSSVTSVELDGVVLVADVDYTLQGDELVRWSGWGGPTATVEVVYDHGYDVIPDEIKQVSLELVTRVWVNPGSVQSETSGAQTVAYANSGLGMLLTEEEKQTIAQMIGRKLGTVTLR